MTLLEIGKANNYHRAAERWPEAPSLSDYLKAIDAAFEGLNHGMAEHVKSFVECVCLTILNELDLTYPGTNPKTTDLLVETLKALGLQNTRGASKMDKVLGAFNKMSDALSEIRNESGPVAHGKDGFIDAISQNHARTFLYVGDALVGALLSAYEGTEPNLLVTREPYERFQHLSARIDDAVSLKASVENEETGSMLVVTLNVAGKLDESIKMRITPSKLLFALDRMAFVEVLNEIPEDMKSVSLHEGEAVEPTPSLDVTLQAEGSTSVEARPSIPIAAPFTGEFNAAIPMLTQLLQQEGITQASSVAEKITQIAEANTGVDWKSREPLLARLRIAIRRSLHLTDIDPKNYPQLVEKIIETIKTCPEVSEAPNKYVSVK